MKANSAVKLHAQAGQVSLGLPCGAVLAYLALTYGGFLWLGPASKEHGSNTATTWFIGAVALAFTVGYVLAKPSWRSGTAFPLERGQRLWSPEVTFLRDRRLLGAASLWWLTMGLYSLRERGLLAPAALWRSVTQPRESYYAKFDGGTETVSAVLQIVNLTGVFYFLLVPILVVQWKRLGWAWRVLGMAGLASYALFFLGMGTQKGIADLAIMLAVALAASSLASTKKRHVRGMAAATAVVLVVLYVVSLSMGQRVDSTSTYVSDPKISQRVESLTPVLGEDASRGMVVVSGYFTGGYSGLASSLELPFEWSYGLGSMRGVSSYLPQYFGVSDPYFKTYPVRVEQEFGRSAKQSWSTVFPWLASDVTFPGVVVLMGLVGFWLGRTWRHFIAYGDTFTLAVLIAFGVFVAYMPANNQLFNDRSSAIGTITLGLLWAYSMSRSRRWVIRWEAGRIATFARRINEFVWRSLERWRLRLLFALRNRVVRSAVTDSSSNEVVSLTTYAARLRTTHLAIESIAAGTVKPARIILWVDHEILEQARAWRPLRRLVARGLEVRGADGSWGPHKKSLPYVLGEAAGEGADEALVLADDDIFYPPDWLHSLTQAYQDEGREVVVSTWVKDYVFEGDQLAPYAAWPSVSDTRVSTARYFMGGAGTVLPTRLRDSLREAGLAFQEHAPRADDIWLNAHAVRTRVGVRQATSVPLKILTVPLSQRVKLSRDNVTNSANDTQLSSTFTQSDLSTILEAM